MANLRGRERRGLATAPKDTDPGELAPPSSAYAILVISSESPLPAASLRLQP